MVTPTYPLFIDDRAGSKELLPYLEHGEACRLEFGDAMIIGNGPTGPVTVGVEVKSISDLLSSIQTGRLAAHQLPGLLRTYDLTWLLGYGHYRVGPEGELLVSSRKGMRTFKLGNRPVPYGYLESFLFDVASTGCRVKHCQSEAEAAAWLKCLHRWFSKRWSDHRGLHVFDASKDISLLPGASTEQNQIARVAKELPGIGFGRASTVALHFNSIAEMMSASVTEWSKIPGIGKVIAQAVVTAINAK